MNLQKCCKKVLFNIRQQNFIKKQLTYLEISLQFVGQCQLLNMNQNSAFSNESKWLHDKKVKLIQDLLGFQSDTYNLNTKLVQEADKIKKQLSLTMLQKQQQQQKHNQQTRNLNIRAKQLEQIIKNKEDHLLAIKREKQQLFEQLKQSKKQQKELHSQIESKQKELSMLKLTSEQQKAQLQAEHNFSKRKQENDIQEIINQYEKKIEEKVYELEQNYQKQIQQIKKNNVYLIEKLENQTKNAIAIKENQQTNNQTETQKILAQNRKLYKQINEYKMNLLNFETKTQNYQQQIKLFEKEKQYHLLNLRRQNSLLKDDKITLETRNKKLLDQIDQLNWNFKQAKIQLEKQLKAYKQELSKQYKQDYEKQTKRIIEVDLNYAKIKQQYQQLQKQYHQLKRQKNNVECDLQYEKNRNKNIQRENISRLNIIEEAGQYQKQIVKKDAEIQALNQQVKKLKTKITKINAAYIQFQKVKDVLQQQNKMLLEEIIILRDKSKNNKKGQWSKVLNVSQDVSKDYEELESYKQVIAEMEGQMVNALKKIQEKDRVIQKLQIRLQKLANSSVINQKNNF